MNSNELVESLYLKLDKYLEKKKIIPNNKGFYRCFTGIHPDKDPSCSVVRENTAVWHCFSCLQSGNIFHAAHYIDKLPIQGPEFWKITLPELAKLFELKYEPSELTEEEKERYQMLRAYRDAADYITTFSDDKSSNIYKHLESRKWTLETARALKIGSVPSFKDYKEAMLSFGWEEKYLKKVELLKPYLFNENNIIFVISDIHGRPVGFACRDTKWIEGKSAKYLNSENSEIYKKRELLYNLWQAKNEGTVLYIVEGYPDVPTMWQNGIKNAVSIGSTSFSHDHVQVLMNTDIRELIFCLDSDKAGQNSMSSIVDAFSRNHDFIIKMCVLPPDEDDPDTFIQKNGAEAFKNLPLMSPFQFRLSKFPYNADPELVCKEVTAAIAMETSPISRSQMIKELFKMTSVPYDAIDQEVKQLLGDKQFAMDSRIQDLVHLLVKKVSKVKEPEILIENTLMDIKAIKKEYHPVDIDIYGKRLLELKETCNNRTDLGFKCGKFSNMELVMGGMPKNAAYMVIAANSNIGKTSFCRDLTMELIKNNDDIFVIFMTIDDSFNQVVPAFIAIDQKLSINEVIYPKLKIKNDVEKWKRLNLGWKRMSEFFSDKLVVKDITEGGTLVHMEQYINIYKNKYPSKKIMVILDNFHKLRDYASLPTTEKFSACSNKIKELIATYDFPFLGVYEVRKHEGKKVTLTDIKNTNEIEYDSNLVLLLHQEYHINRQTNMVWDFDKGFGLEKFPINELCFAKNKLGDFKGTLYFKFKPYMSIFDDMVASEAEELLKKDMEHRKNAYD